MAGHLKKEKKEERSRRQAIRPSSVFRRPEDLESLLEEAISCISLFGNAWLRLKCLQQS